MHALPVEDAVQWVQEVLMGPGRTRPVVAVTTRHGGGEVWIDPGELNEAMGAEADVVLFETGWATRQLAAALPARLEVYGGALRVWWPGLSAGSEPLDHPLHFIHSAVEARQVRAQVLHEIQTFAARRRHGLQILNPTATDLASMAGKPALQMEGPARARTKEDPWIPEKGVSLQKQALLEGEIEALKQQVQKVRKEMKSWQDRCRGRVKASAMEIDPLSSPRALLLGVRLAYARAFDETDRLDYPLRSMSVGRGFLATLRGSTGIDLGKVLQVCAQVAAGRAHEIAARQVHRLRSGPRGSPTRQRRSDGAQAWRCALQVNTPSARRLHWWQISGPRGDQIEFASVGVHDMFQLPS